MAENSGTLTDLDVTASIQQTLLQISADVIEKTLSRCETVAQDRPIQVFPQASADSSINIEVTWWTDPKPVDIRRSRAEVVTSVKQALDDAGIEIPFPYRTLVFKDTLAINRNDEVAAAN